MLYPKMNHARSLTDLGGIWRFKLGDETEPGEIWNSPQEMELISVPASYNDQKDDPAYRNHYGWAYYERTVELPAFLYKQSGQHQGTALRRSNPHRQSISERQTDFDT